MPGSGAPGVPGPVAPSPPSLPALLTGLVLFRLVRTRVPGFRADLVNPGLSHLEILDFFTSAKTPFPNKVTFPGTRC